MKRRRLRERVSRVLREGSLRKLEPVSNQASKRITIRKCVSTETHSRPCRRRIAIEKSRCATILICREEFVLRGALCERRKALPTEASSEVWNPFRVPSKIKVGDQATKGTR